MNLNKKDEHSLMDTILVGMQSTRMIVRSAMIFDGDIVAILFNSSKHMYFDTSILQIPTRHCIFIVMIMLGQRMVC
jgi:hypothetical protein